MNSTQTSHPLRIGLTGGIASGKSAATEYFAARGAPVIDTDVIAREVVEPGTAGLRKLVEAFGDSVLDSSGRLNRPALRKLIFADDKAREKINDLLHPLIQRRSLQIAAEAGGPYQVFAVPLLTETDFAGLMDRILVIDCPAELQKDRLMHRDGETATSSERILATQAGREQRLQLADDVIVNDGTLEELERAVDRLHHDYLGLAATHGK